MVNLTKKEDDKPLEIITREEFENGLETKLTREETKVEKAIQEYNLFVKGYNLYIKDKLRFIIKYFIQDEVMFYTKKVRKSPGFKHYE